ncbi:MAG TPA: flagellar basal body-associated FliL family protein [Bacteriovoracaceae bacterium]|nr:flagellar basal body-associated FliL family protein [Bacteriovoracaceae bacterium]
MNFLIKLESTVNAFIMKVLRRIFGLIPAGFISFSSRALNWCLRNAGQVKYLPAVMKSKAASALDLVKRTVRTFNYKEKLIECYNLALSQYLHNKPGATKKIKAAVTMPFILIGSWLQGLTTTQSLMLLTFSAASFLAVIGVTFSGQKLANHHLESTRAPASLEEELDYDRPGYYKEEVRHFSISNFRLPVYFSQINELRSIDIDFTATMTTRRSRVFLEKQEFQLRDHLILYIEPVLASFPLEEEGKEIIREKLQAEINEFLKSQGQEGVAVELKLTYILAN